MIALSDLATFASRYVWWKPVNEAVLTPHRIIAQVMNVGDYGDVQALVREVGDETLRRVLADAEAGEFNARSWVYWHYRLNLAEIGRVPAMPARKTE